MTRSLQLALAPFLFAVFLLACSDDEGSASPCPGPGCACMANDCVCDDGVDCTWESIGDDAFTCGRGSSCDAECTGEGCDVICVESARCAVDAGSAVDVRCADVTDSCEVTAGPDADLECASSRCELVVGDEADVDCIGTADCVVECTARCTLACGENATCELRCAGADPVTVAGDETGTCE